MNANVQLPQGVRDYIGQEAYCKRWAEQRARETFLMAGYEEVETPTFEYATVFEDELGDLRRENMVHFFDADGRMLTLRPDFTRPCARLISARARQFGAPVRVFYIGNAFGLEHNTGQTRREFTQAGAELMGASGADADAEILVLAQQLLRGMGLPRFVIDIGHIGVFFGLLRACRLTGTQADRLRSLLDDKNEQEARDYLRTLAVDPALAEQFLLLPRMYGGMEVVQRAKACFPLPACQQALEELQRICDILRDYGLTDCISVDLGLLNNMDYYTGTVFRAMAPGVGTMLLSGGRYDSVLESFGRPMPATGFAMGIGRVLAALQKAGAWQQQKTLDVLIGAAPGRTGQALALAAQLREQGRMAVVSFAHTWEEVAREASARSVQELVWMEASGTCNPYKKEGETWM